MRDFYITFVSDDIDKMRIFGALLDAGMENFVISETYPDPKEKHTCLSCEYGKEALYCSRDDVYVLKDDIKASEKCELWSEKDVDEASTVAENETTTDDDHSCATCEWYTDGRCLKDCENHEWFDYCLNHKPKAATTNDHFRDVRKKIASEDVQPVVHAHWILLSGGVARCSNCNRCVGSWDYDNTDNYCRVCGAMMDEESEAG